MILWVCALGVIGEQCMVCVGMCAVVVLKLVAFLRVPAHVLWLGWAVMAVVWVRALCWGAISSSCKCALRC